jgi:hypothetical protein
MLMRTDPFRELDRLAQQMTGRHSRHLVAANPHADRRTSAGADVTDHQSDLGGGRHLRHNHDARRVSDLDGRTAVEPTESGQPQ